MIPFVQVGVLGHRGIPQSAVCTRPAPLLFPGILNPAATPMRKTEWDRPDMDPFASPANKTFHENLKKCTTEGAAFYFAIS